MSAQQTDQGSLASAHLRIAGLLDELNNTVESVESLAHEGESEAVLRLVEDQRASLYAAVDSIARIVGVRRSRWALVRRHVSALSAAALLAVSGIAGAVGIISRTDSPADRQAGRSPASSSFHRGKGATSAGGAGAGTDVTAAGADGGQNATGGSGSGGSDDFLGSIDPPDPGTNDSLVGKARQFADDAQEGNPQPPAQGQPAIEELHTIVRQDDRSSSTQTN